MRPERTSRDELPVPGSGGLSAGTRDGQQVLRLHAGIAVVAFVLCAFVTGVFFYLGTPVLAVVFAVLAVTCLGCSAG